MPASCAYARTGQHTCRARCVAMFHNGPEFRLFLVFVSVETRVCVCVLLGNVALKARGF